jgi:perosamine synthetase
MKVIPLAEPWIGKELGDAVARQVASGFLGPGPATRDFAQALADLAGVPFCVPTVSGTMALTVAAQALELPRGAEILVPAYGVISTINAFASWGYAPRLVEIDRKTACMDPERLEAAIRPSTAAVCFVNFSGRTGPELLEIAAICRKHGLPLIEDAACAMGHAVDGHNAGSIGDVGVYSFSVPKVLTTGQGGAVLCKTEQQRDGATRAIDHGDTTWRQTNLNRGIGNNLRFNDVQSSLGLAQLATLGERLARRRRNHAAMRAVLGDHLHAVCGSEAPLHNVVFSTMPEQLVAHLRGQGILAAQQYRAIYQHPPYAALQDGDYPHSEFWTRHAVYLPFGTGMEADDATRVAQAVRECNYPFLLP